MFSNSFGVERLLNKWIKNYILYIAVNPEQITPQFASNAQRFASTCESKSPHDFSMKKNMKLSFN